MLEFFKKIIVFLDANNIPYMLSGSVAMSVYVLPRATRDFDFIVNLSINDASKVIDNFAEGFYCDADAVKEAIKKRSMFNIIDFNSGFKADFVILKEEKYRQVEFSRRTTAQFFDSKIFIVTAEDLLLSKLIWIQELQSNLQMDDIKTLAKKQDLDWNYIDNWIDVLQLKTFDLI